MQHTKSTATSFTFSEQELPVRMGRYHLLSRLSRDPISEQFLSAWGVEQGIDQLRVIRCIYPRVAQEAEFIGLFQEEARALSRLSSDNIARIMEVNVQGDIPFVAREYVEGLTLERLLVLAASKKQKLPWELSVHIATEILRGLDYIHRREDIHGNPMGMRHGDVRPGTVIVSFAGEVKLINFGSMLRFIVDEATHAQLMELRNAYLPPEMRDEADPCESGDRWAVAMILNTLMGGPIPVLGEENRWSAPRLSKLVDGAPKVLDEFIERAFHSNPDERFKTAAAMRSVLVEILGDHASGHPPDDLAILTEELGRDDDRHMKELVRSMLKKPAEISLGNTARGASMIGPGYILDGRYHLLRELGEGGMGTVFEAEHQGLGKKCAVKVLHERVMSDSSTVERFKREAQIIGNIGHPNIVGAQDFGICEKGYYYLAMDLLDGKPLSHRIWEGNLSYYEICRIMSEVCDGLQAAHEAGVIHRDLKPDNVHLTSNGARILDFGIAKTVGLDSRNEALTRTGHICGTVDYIAPEQIRGGSDDPRSDLYAVGVMIYECLTGETPFHGRTVGEALHKAINDKLVYPSKRSGKKDIPTQLESVCVKALNRKAEKRFDSAKEMGVTLRDIASKLQSSATNGDDGDGNTRDSISTLGKDRFMTIWLPVAAAGLIVAVVSLMLFFHRGKNSVADGPVHENGTAGDSGHPIKMSSEVHSTSAAGNRHVAEQAAAVALPGGTAQAKPAGERELMTVIQPSTEIDTDDPDVLRMVEELAVREKSQEESLRLSEELIKRGNEKIANRDFRGARNDFSEAIRHNHRAGDAWFGYGKAAFELGDYSTAIEKVRRSLNYSSPSKQTKRRNYLGLLYKVSGDSKKAVVEWERVLAMNPGNPEAKRYLESTLKKGEK
ncbi:MAG: protein kinase [Deltaproteobacteria bacterium]|nr:protein kinase [Deltaproteobacteria bacterium]